MNNGIGSVVTTFDSKHAFYGLGCGSLHQICIDSQKVIKDYGQIHDRGINSMAVSRDNSFLITGSYDQRFLKISIPNQKVVKECGGIKNCFIKTIDLGPGDESLFVFYCDGNLKLIELNDGTIVYDFGRVYSGEIDGFIQSLLTKDGEHLFTISLRGGLKQ